ncbi:hypothetical protein J1N35_028394 [Gossypium stocksii]|uniref:Uncharacterized protein n=1 Tax=Gossypium stocksii TaxID=47602 RepID=A0A9D3UVW2_9ROSI|nr:hypothetical protein J1N35_028394 [Gossypium stocksii]
MLMFYVGNSYAGMTLSYMDRQSVRNIGFNIGLTRTNDVLPTTCSSQGTSNLGHEIVTSEGPNNAIGTQSDFTAYEPPLHMLNVDINTKDRLEFLKLPHRILGHTSSFTNFGDLQIGMEFSSKDVVDAMKWYSIKHGINSMVQNHKRKNMRRSVQCVATDIFGKSGHWYVIRSSEIGF